MVQPAPPPPPPPQVGRGGGGGGGVAPPVPAPHSLRQEIMAAAAAGEVGGLAEAVLARASDGELVRSSPTHKHLLPEAGSMRCVRSVRSVRSARSVRPVRPLPSTSIR